MYSILSIKKQKLRAVYSFVRIQHSYLYLSISDGYWQASSEKPGANALAPCKQPISDGSADGST
jgi:hypothetical protein